MKSTKNKKLIIGLLTLIAGVWVFGNNTYALSCTEIVEWRSIRALQQLILMPITYAYVGILTSLGITIFAHNQKIRKIGIWLWWISLIRLLLMGVFSNTQAQGITSGSIFYQQQQDYGGCVGFWYSGRKSLLQNLLPLVLVLHLINGIILQSMMKKSRHIERVTSPWISLVRWIDKKVSQVLGIDDQKITEQSSPQSDQQNIQTDLTPITQQITITNEAMTQSHQIITQPIDKTSYGGYALVFLNILAYLWMIFVWKTDDTGFGILILVTPVIIFITVPSVVLFAHKSTKKTCIQNNSTIDNNQQSKPSQIINITNQIVKIIGIILSIIVILMIIWIHQELS